MLKVAEGIDPLKPPKSKSEPKMFVYQKSSFGEGHMRGDGSVVTKTYQYRDPEKRKEYMRDLMRERRKSEKK